VFTCTSDHADVAAKLKIPLSRCGTIIDSSASRHFCPDRSKFVNFTLISDSPITGADGRTFKALSTGDMHIELSNGSKQTPFVLKDAVYAPEMAFMLILIRCLMRAGLSVNFIGNSCKIAYLNGQVIGTLPYSTGLYQLVASLADEARVDYANVALLWMTLYEAHCKLRHVAYLVVKHMICVGIVTGVKLDLTSKEGVLVAIHM
jgi:uncharacterized membrane protein